MYSDLFPGPVCHDGNPSWLCVFEHIPAGYQWRPDVRSGWLDPSSSTDAVPSDQWVQVRRPPPQLTDCIEILQPGFEHQITYGQVRQQIASILDYVGASDATNRIAIGLWHLFTQAR